MDESWTVKGATKIKDGLYVGDERAALTFANLHSEMKVTHIVNCADHIVWNYAAVAGSGVKYLLFRWENDGFATVLDDDDQNANKLFDFIEEGLNAGGCVLVHSTSADENALVAMAAYLMRKYAWSWRKTSYYLQDVNLKTRRISSFLTNQLTNYERRLQAVGCDEEVTEEAAGRDEEVKEEATLLENTVYNSRSHEQRQEHAPPTRSRSTKTLTWCEDTQVEVYEQVYVEVYYDEEATEEASTEEEEEEDEEKEAEAQVFGEESASPDEGKAPTTFRQLPSVGSWLSRRPIAAQVEALVAKEEDTAIGAEQVTKLRKDSVSTAEGSSTDEAEEFPSVHENEERMDEFSWWQGLTAWLCLGRGM
eukprot:TRINITY_DN6463_c0_g1_i3.p1 TRINITY_DN6463_c0_g1~~TRINITY_DN6463_c0_g1_i3.p1  ORF type:complete len:387 (-),score=114.39 TRINITY_DN6463_c0_g1_i3:193-1284(-)